MPPLKTPDITPAQIISALTAILGAITVLFKLDLTDPQRAAAVTLIGTIVPFVWLVADALIRRARANAAAAAQLAAVATPSAAAAAPPAAPPTSAAATPRSHRRKPTVP